MPEFKHRQIEVPFLDQTHANFDEWASLVKRMQAERDLEIVNDNTQRNATWCHHCAAYLRPDGIKSCLRKACEHKDKKP